MKVSEFHYSVVPMRVPSQGSPSPQFSSRLSSEAQTTHNAIGTSAARQIHAILDEEAELDAAMARSLNGESMDQREMLELQATVYSYSQRVDVATRVIDRGANAIKQLLNTQL